MNKDEFLFQKFHEADKPKGNVEVSITMTSSEWFKIQEAVKEKSKLEVRVAAWIDYAYHLKGIIGELSWKK